MLCTAGQGINLQQRTMERKAGLVPVQHWVLRMQDALAQQQGKAKQKWQQVRIMRPASHHWSQLSCSFGVLQRWWCQLCARLKAFMLFLVLVKSWSTLWTVWGSLCHGRQAVPWNLWRRKATLCLLQQMPMLKAPVSCFSVAVNLWKGAVSAPGYLLDYSQMSDVRRQTF